MLPGGATQGEMGRTSWLHSGWILPTTAGLREIISWRTMEQRLPGHLVEQYRQRHTTLLTVIAGDGWTNVQTNLGLGSIGYFKADYSLPLVTTNVVQSDRLRVQHHIHPDAVPNAAVFSCQEGQYNPLFLKKG